MKEITISLILRTMNGLIYSPYYSAMVYYMLIHPPWKLYEVGFQPTMIEHEVTLIVPPTFGFLESNLHSWNEIVPNHAVNWSLIEHKPPCYLWVFLGKKKLKSELVWTIDQSRLNIQWIGLQHHLLLNSDMLFSTQSPISIIIGLETMLCLNP